MGLAPHMPVWLCSFVGSCVASDVYIPTCRKCSLCEVAWQQSYTCICTSHSSGDVCLHSSATATAAEQSLREEQERRAEAGRQVQALKKGMSGELPTLLPFVTYLMYIFFSSYYVCLVPTLQNVSFNKDLCYVICTSVSLSILPAHVLGNNNLFFSHGPQQSQNR